MAEVKDRTLEASMTIDFYLRGASWWARKLLLMNKHELMLCMNVRC